MHRLCYTEFMLRAQQRGVILRPRPSLPPFWLGQLALVLFVVALVLGPWLRSGTSEHDDPHVAFAGLLAASAVALHTYLPTETAPADSSASATSAHSHCAMHCSLATFMLPLLLGALLLAARLAWCFLLSLQYLGTAPLSPPPQPAP